MIYPNAWLKPGHQHRFPMADECGFTLAVNSSVRRVTTMSLSEITQSHSRDIPATRSKSM